MHPVHPVYCCRGIGGTVGVTTFRAGVTALGVGVIARVLV